jgi:hypothetical protein
MKRIILLIAVLVLLLLASPVFAELELGMSITPASTLKGEAAKQYEEDFVGKSDTATFLENNFVGFHVGFSWWWLFYASWDAMVMPPWWIQQITTYERVNADGSRESVVGKYLPGYLNLFDVGIRPTIGPIVIMAEIGVNNIYVYKQSEDKSAQGGLDFGANLKVGAGLRFDFWSATLTGTSVFASTDQMISVLKLLGGSKESTRMEAVRSLVETLIPSVNVNIHF